MTKKKLYTLLWGTLLIVLGVAALAYTFGALDNYTLVTAYVTAAFLALLGIGFLLAIIFQRENWFYVIPGFSLLSLGGMIYLTTQENVRPEWLGALFLGGIALGFLVIFLRNRQERWWALLQMETILIIALVGLGMGIPESATRVVGAILFGGFAASFFFVWLLSGHRARFLWALILAGVLAAFAAAIFTAGQSPMLRMLWPLAILLIGLFLCVRAFAAGEKAPPPVSVESLPLTPEPDADEGPAQIQLPAPMTPRAVPEPEPAPEPAEPEDVEIIEPAAAEDEA